MIVKKMSQKITKRKTQGNKEEGPRGTFNMPHILVGKSGKWGEMCNLLIFGVVFQPPDFA